MKRDFLFASNFLDAQILIVQETINSSYTII